MESRAEEYRLRAERCLEMGPTFHNPQARDVLLQMAHVWLRLADKCEYTNEMVGNPPAVTPDPGFELLFDGTSLGDWTMSTIRNQPGRDDPGGFLGPPGRSSRKPGHTCPAPCGVGTFRQGVLESQSGTDVGLLWLTRPTPPRYVLRLQWMMRAPDDNSGVFLDFPDPTKEGYDNTAYVGVNFGFEIQIDELARPDNAPIHRTGAVYGFKGPDVPPLTHPVGEWNHYEITVDGPDLTVALNGQVINQFHFTGDPQSLRRCLPSSPQDPRFIGLQTHTGRLFFRRIQWRAL